MVLIAISLSSSYFVWSLSQNTVYNDAIRQINQVDSNHLSESVTVQNTTYNVVSANLVNVSAQVQNQGSLAIQFVTLWVRISNGAWSSYNFTSLSNMNVPAGAPYNFTVSTYVPGAIVGQGYSFASWLITARGNGVTLLQVRTFTNNIVVSQTAQGIGSVAFDFEQFWHYDFSSTPAQGTSLPSASSKNYTVSEGNYTVYHVVLTDFDLLGQNIVLDGNSTIFILGQQARTVKWGQWNLVNVTNNKIYPNSGVQYTLQFGATTDLYFSGSISSIDTPNLYPLNILLSGKKGNNDYGQNIPFVSIYLVN